MAEVMGQRGSDDFIVEHDFGSFLVQGDRVSAIHNVDSLLARGYWEDPSADVDARKRAIALVESFIDGLPVVLKVGAEMGSISVRALQTSRGQRFLLERVDNSGDLLDEDDAMPPVHAMSRAESWEDCLRQLDAYPWQRLYPVAVHPEFAAVVLAAVKARLDPLGSGDPRSLGRWGHACQAGVP